MKLSDDFLQYFKIQNKSPNFNLLLKITNSFSLIPYENATKIIKRNRTKCVVDRPRQSYELISNFIKNGTGGTCFSLVYTLYEILKELRFNTYLVLADRTYGANTHSAVIVVIDKCKYILDPGFLVPFPILVLKKAIIQMQMNELVIEEDNKTIKVSSLKKNNLKFRYLIKDVEISSSEFISTWNESFEWKMMDNIYLTKLFNGGQLFIKDNRVEIITSEKREKYFINKNTASEIAKLFNISPNILMEAEKWRDNKK